MAVTRVYLMRGLCDTGGILEPGMAQIADMLRARGAVVTLGEWTDEARFIGDASDHRDDHLIFAGHSMGCWAAFDAAWKLKLLHNLSARVVGLDPLCTHPVWHEGIDATVIWGNYCGVMPAEVPGARNIFASGGPHITYPCNPRIQKLFITEILGPDKK